MSSLILRILAVVSMVWATSFAFQVQAEERPLWLTHVAIAPDASKIAFTYRGQVHIVDARAGGQSSSLTALNGYNHNIIWSPDSKQIAFASDVNGDDDIYLTDLATGKARRLSWSDAPETPDSFTSDGKRILFNRLGLGDPKTSLQGPLTGLPQLYALDVVGGSSRLVLPNAANEAVWNGDGTLLAYSYNPSLDPPSRQRRVLSNARQIWLFDRESRQHRRVLPQGFDAFDPNWSTDGQSLYYLSEESGDLNVWKTDLTGQKRRQITHFTGHPVRFLSVARNGTLAFTWNGKLFRQDNDDAEPVAIPLAFGNQQVERPVKKRDFTPSDFKASPDGKFWAVISDAQVFLANRAGKYVQVSAGEEPRRDLAFSPDGLMLAYAAMRDGRWSIFGVPLKNVPPLANKPRLSETKLVDFAGRNVFEPKFSPDGRKIAYIADRREVEVMDLASGAVTKLFRPSDYNTSYSDGDLWFSWSPDSRFILTAWRQVPFAVIEEAGVVPADGSLPIRPLSSAITSFSDGIWSADGTQIVALTNMFSPRDSDQSNLAFDLYRVFMSPKARADFYGMMTPAELAAKKKRLEAYDFAADRRSFLEGRLTPASAQHFYAAAIPGKDQIVSVAASVSMDALAILLLDLKTGSFDQVVDGSSLDQYGNLYPRLSSYVPALNSIDIATENGIVSIPLSKPDATKGVSFAFEYMFDPVSRRRAAFEQVWANIKYKFYRSDTEGRDWNATGDDYRRLLDGVASDRELSELISDMFGTISASHLFVAFKPGEQPAAAAGKETPSEPRRLGYFTDQSGTGIAAILQGGPLDRGGVDITPGDRIVSIDKVPVTNENDIDRLMRAAGSSVALGVLKPGQNKPQVFTVTPISLTEERALNYQRWVDERRALVTELSKGCVAYAHMPEMDGASYSQAYGRLLSARRAAKAALLDIRSNRGGNEHRQVLDLLSGRPFAKVGREDRHWDTEPLDRWLGPSAMLVDSFAYSDGSITPQAFQDAGFGPLVGDRLLNTGTGVDYIQSDLMPSLVYGIPVQPFRRLDGRYYENSEIVPDVAVPFDPNLTSEGRDPQLEAAVRTLMGKIGADGDCRLDR